MKTTAYCPAHPIVFVFDSSNDRVDVPVYDPEKLVSFNDSCVSIRTISDVDGDVTVNLAAGAHPGSAVGGIEVFRGIIDTPGGNVALVTSENQTLLELSAARPRSPIRVLVDDETHPSQIWVEILDIASSIH